MTRPIVMPPDRILIDGHHIPPLGLGTYPLRGDDAVAAVSSALSLGYRLVDTAVHYGNESAVGQAIRDSGVPREDLCVVSKLPGRHHRRREAQASTHASLKALGLDYLDLHLIHWPNPTVGRFVEAWQALIELQQAGLVRSIGVSNSTPQHLDRLVEMTGVLPAVNQIEMHPMFPQAELRRVHESLGISTLAWSPLGRGKVGLTAPPITKAAERSGGTPAQVVLRWHLHLGSIPVPKSSDPERQRQNLDILGLELTDVEVQAISALGRPNGRTGGDPELHVEM